jgi:glycosyltransferase involved in cell wall biosynthesis
MPGLEKVLITGGREVGGVTAFATGLAEGFTALGIPNEVIPPQMIFARLGQLRDPAVLKILSTTAVFAAPVAHSAICVSHGFPRADTHGWLRMLAILASLKTVNASPGARLVAVSHYNAEHLRALFGLRVDGVIQNPLASCFFEQFAKVPERCYVTYVGRLISAKNVHRLLPPLCALASENSGLSVCVIGDGPLRQSLEQTFGADPRVRFTGALDPLGVRSYLRRTRLFVSGNALEPLGITYLEALSQGCVVAMPASGGGLEIALPWIGRNVHLLPLSYAFEDTLHVFRTALRCATTPVPLTRHAPAAVASAYLDIAKGFECSPTPRREPLPCASTRCD